jgi:hypothetical protein
VPSIQERQSESGARSLSGRTVSSVAGLSVIIAAE